MLERCDGLRGETVEFALMTCKYEKGGAELRYRLSDLKLDVKAGRLEVPGKGNASSAAPRRGNPVLAGPDFHAGARRVPSWHALAP